jgi:hypothetical protein
MITSNYVPELLPLFSRNVSRSFFSFFPNSFSCRDLFQKENWCFQNVAKFSTQSLIYIVGYDQFLSYLREITDEDVDLVPEMPYTCSGANFDGNFASCLRERDLEDLRKGLHLLLQLSITDVGLLKILSQLYCCCRSLPVNDGIFLNLEF